ncbi:hypothetical protein Pmani_034418 [Petrolisthes manimaculis]|uniref:Uncharacterized protein n=1 Tax=Petrolisthes manimaculis TaxID=1843537 RepID=A0AAE1NPE2_9EUCA|nr:hypothetical protein Pmani_034418 [Petrolisthes manimaculis]
MAAVRALEKGAYRVSSRNAVEDGGQSGEGRGVWWWSSQGNYERSVKVMAWSRRVWDTAVLWYRRLGLVLAGPYCRVPGCGILTTARHQA